ncbi:MAG TPA: hypothetical protein VM008_21700 [Phycisphaerae bacterium]|nr:hypothetical protein [Phycisphaerae bacterium]
MGLRAKSGGKWRRRLKKTAVVLVTAYAVVLVIAFALHVPDRLIVMTKAEIAGDRAWLLGAVTDQASNGRK